MSTPTDPKKHPEVHENDGYKLLINVLGFQSGEVAGQSSDVNPEIKSADQNIPKPEVNRQVEQALKSNPYVDGSGIRVFSQGSRIILCGKVRSWFQKEEAGKVAKQASGNLNVINDIAISYGF